MTRQLILLAALILLGAAGAGAAAGTFGTFLSDNHEAFRTYGLIFAGVAGLGFAVWRARIANKQAQASQRQAHAAYEQAQAANEQARAAHAQVRISEQGHITDRFSVAVEHLGSPQLPVRLGGIYALWRLIKDSPERDVISVIDILCAFVRDPPHPPVDTPEPHTHEGVPAAAKDEANVKNKLRVDVQAILNLIGVRDAPYRSRLPDSYRLDLSFANLAHANLHSADLTGADLSFAKLTGARLAGANLTNAHLFLADLSNAHLIGANFTGAILMMCTLTYTLLGHVNFTHANLQDAKLTGADLTNANLIGANLTGAKLTDTDLEAANLSDSNLARADLTGADLTGADLTGARNLTQKQLDPACIRKDGEPPALPEGLKPPPKVCVPWEQR